MEEVIPVEEGAQEASPAEIVEIVEIVEITIKITAESPAKTRAEIIPVEAGAEVAEVTTIAREESSHGKNEITCCNKNF
jgi:hypothetical protein